MLGVLGVGRTTMVFIYAKVVRSMLDDMPGAPCCHFKMYAIRYAYELASMALG